MRSRKHVWLAAIVAVAVLMAWLILVRGVAPDASVPEDTTDAEMVAGQVHLPHEKLLAAGIETTPAQRRPMRPYRTVPGRIQYDNRRHVDVKAAAAGSISGIEVKTGDAVSAGQTLALLSSSEIGAARADVLKSEAELVVANEKRDWELTTSDALERLAAAVRQRRDIESIRGEFQEVKLGAERDTILGAYARLLLAERLAESASLAGANGAEARNVVQQRLRERDSAGAALLANIEQSQFNATQDRQIAQAQADDAKRRLDISREHLASLLGYDEANCQPIADEDSTSANLSFVRIRAPFDGTIERTIYSTTERVQLGDTLFILADTTSLWVAADLREREWPALELAAGDAIGVTSPALPNVELKACVYYVGREVDPLTNAVPLMATIDNRDGRLRPGMFVRVTLPVGEPREVLAVRESALCEHEGVRFVFVAIGDDAFQRVDVVTGQTDGGWVEVVSGLSDGQPVVTSGAFHLKSELLLEGEE